MKIKFLLIYLIIIRKARSLTVTCVKHVRDTKCNIWNEMNDVATGAILFVHKEVAFIFTSRQGFNCNS
jgi:hypothetical protein